MANHRYHQFQPNWHKRERKPGRELWRQLGGQVVLALLILLAIASYHLGSQWWLQARTFRPVETEAIALANEPITPLPQTLDLDPEKIKLGEKLFNDPHLSANNEISCASCHNIRLGGVDHRTVAVGMNQQVGQLNTPTVFNSRFNFRQFWDGRAATLEEQIDGPIHDAKEMGSSWPVIMQKLRAIPAYTETFDLLYPAGITEATIKNAIATYERSLITPSRFDRYLRGELSALTVAERDGYRRFKEVGCVTCHQGINIGGNLFQKIGLFGDYFRDRNAPITPADYGRYNVTQEERDRYVFKVPSLRHITRTAPYFHDGSAQTLEEAVRRMSRYQLGQELSAEDTELIIRFLITLTGEEI
ncbi:MAG: cytochrome-c peroxidase [Cyanobacteria bacterium P01_G01_bin.54]